MKSAEVLKRLKAWANPQNVTGMARFGINPESTLGIPIPKLRGLAKDIGVDHKLAHALWASGIHEARILAGMIDDPALVTSAQMERWVKAFDSWDVCDQVCMNLFDKTRLAHSKALVWSKREAEFVKRAGFALMACLAWHDKTAGDAAFLKFLPAIQRGADDERNFVKKAVNWALRQIGKRSRKLNREAIRTAREIQKLDSRAARWVAADALRELTSPAMRGRLRG